MYGTTDMRSDVVPLDKESIAALDLPGLAAELRAAPDLDALYNLYCSHIPAFDRLPDPALEEPVAEAYCETWERLQEAEGDFVVVEPPSLLIPTAEEDAELEATYRAGRAAFSAADSPEDESWVPYLRRLVSDEPAFASEYRHRKSIYAEIERRLTISQTVTTSDEATALIIAIYSAARSNEELQDAEQANGATICRLSFRQQIKLRKSFEGRADRLKNGPIELYDFDGTYAGYVETSAEDRRFLMEKLRSIGAHGSWLIPQDPEMVKRRDALMHYNANAIERLTKDDYALVEYASGGAPIKVVRNKGEVLTTMDVRLAAHVLTTDLAQCATPGEAMGLWHGNNNQNHFAVRVIKEYAIKEYEKMRETYQNAIKEVSP